MVLKGVFLYLIGHCDYFGFDFTTLSRKALSWNSMIKQNHWKRSAYEVYCKRSAYEVYCIQVRNNNFSDCMLRSSCELFQLYYLCTVCSLLLDPAITNLSIFLLVISLPLSSIFTISNEYQFEYQLFRLVSKRRLSVVKRLSETAMASPVWYMNTFGGVQGFTKSTAFTSNQTAHLSRILAQHGGPQLSFDSWTRKKKRKSNIKLTNLKRITPMMTQNDHSRNFSLHC